MREVRVPTGFAAQSCRHVIVAIATWLIVLQAFLAGVAAAQAAATPASVAGDAICHGSSASADGPAGTAPEEGKVRHLCCVACTSAAPALALPEAPKPLQLLPRRRARRRSQASSSSSLPAPSAPDSRRHLHRSRERVLAAPASASPSVHVLSLEI